MKAIKRIVIKAKLRCSGLDFSGVCDMCPKQDDCSSATPQVCESVVAITRKDWRKLQGLVRAARKVQSFRFVEDMSKTTDFYEALIAEGKALAKLEGGE